MRAGMPRLKGVVQMVRIIVFALGAVLFCIVVATGTWALILNTADINALCRSPAATHRNTIVYVDLSSLKPGEDEWGYTILKKLELAPRERLTVLAVNPSNFEVLEVFASCYPAFTQSEIDHIRQNRSLWDKLILPDREAQQRDNLQTFDARLRNSLDKVLSASTKFSLGKRRDILGAIAVDKNRFTDRGAFYRIIIFTNGVITDDFETGANETQIVDLLTKKYPTSFSGAEVSILGVTGGDRTETLESKERIFTSFFLKNWARVRSFTPSLPQQTNISFSAIRTMTGTFEGGGTKGSVKLSFATTEKSAEIWLSFVLGANSLYVPIEGEYSCSGETCELQGKVIENIPLLSSTPYFRTGDRLVLVGKNGEKLIGALRPESREVFTPDNGSAKIDEVKYQMEFGSN
jgi:hypothetical protein